MVALHHPVHQDLGTLILASTDGVMLFRPILTMHEAAAIMWTSIVSSHVTPAGSLCIGSYSLSSPEAVADNYKHPSLTSHVGWKRALSCVFKIVFQFPCCSIEPFIFISFHLLYFVDLQFGRDRAQTGHFFPARNGCDAGSAAVVPAGPVQLPDCLRCRFGGAN